MNSEDESLRIICQNGGFWLDKDGWTFSFEPPELVRLSLPPYVEGIDWWIRSVLDLKGINSDFLKIRFSQSLFLGCDAQLSYSNSTLSGWIYAVKKEFLQFNTEKKLWICPQLKLFFDSPPKELFISVEKETN